MSEEIYKAARLERDMDEMAKAIGVPSFMRRKPKGPSKLKQQVAAGVKAKMHPYADMEASHRAMQAAKLPTYRRLNTTKESNWLNPQSETRRKDPFGYNLS